MPARGGDFERALGALLSLDLIEIQGVLDVLADLGRRPREHLRAAYVIDELQQRGRRENFHLRARPGRFRSAGCRANETVVARISGNRGRQCTGDRRQRAVEPELADYGEAAHGVGRDRADRGHESERDRQIVMAAFLRQIGRRQIDRDAFGRQRQARSDQRRAHAVARFGDGLVGKTDEIEGGKSRRDLHLHVHGPSLDALEGHRCDVLDHATPAFNLAERL